MPRTGEARSRSSIIERLIDLHPESPRETAGSTLHNVQQMKEAVCADLLDLLNTRRTEWAGLSRYRQANNSLLTYGLPDLSTRSLANTGHQETLIRAIEDAIELFEPRLTQVSVSLHHSDDLPGVMRCRVEALLRVEPTPEPITFDTVLHTESSRFDSPQGGR